jgi:uncharacterized delta-60 repeat protein
MFVAWVLGASVLVGADPVAASGVPGTPDTSFSTGTGFGNAVRTLAVQSDGKIIVGGLFTAFNGTTVDRIARLNADGTLDGSFTSNTLVGSVYAVVVQSDGKVIVGGAFTNRIARLNADGTTDTSFSRSASGLSNSVEAVAVQSDGKIIVGGAFTNRIARLNADGTPDTTFSTGTGFSSNVQAVAVQSDGKIIVGGFFTAFNGTPANYIARLDANGTLDGSFTSNTLVGSVHAVAVQSDGKIIVGGAFTNRIARLNTDGTPDTAFTTNTGTGFSTTVRAVAVQSDGKIIVGGDFTTLNGVTANRIARLDANGNPDTAFSTGTGTGFDGVVRAVAVQSDGKIIVGGDFRKLNGVTVNYIARLLGGSAPDTNTGSSESGVPVFSLSFDSMPGVLVSGAVGSWVSLPTLTNPPATNLNSTFLGWATYEEFPIDIAQRQIDNGWGAYEVFRDDGSLRGVFIPVDGSACIAAPESLYPIWSDSSA